MARPKSQIRIFDYTDYRAYLGDYYKEQKERYSYFSYRYFANKAGIRSIGLYKDVVDGKQSLSRRAIAKFSEAIGHGKREAEYFEAMVFYTDAETVEERKYYFERMMECHESKARVIEASRYEYYSQWYYSAIRALLSFYSFDGVDYNSLAKQLSPRITAEQAKKAVETLERLGMIKRKENGFFEPCDQIITTGQLNNNRQAHTMNIVNFQKNLLSLASEAYDRYSERQMDMSTITLSISKKTRQMIKEEAAVFRKRVLSLAEKDTNPECLYQLNCQFFPLTDPGKDD
ncbi:MAG TPA: TIGR02147 family protein [Chitinispirillaceae bacterium]|nr:TIGR02147 family protein [Chitinispirillaceae bacterium]